MSTKHGWSWLVVAMLILAFSLGACGDKKPDQQASSSTSTESMAQEEPLTSEADTSILEGRTSAPMLPIYFEFDSSSITGDQVARIENNAGFIKENPHIIVRIEGNCDPRGTNEYNIALGERRAQAAKSFLIRKGIDRSQLTTVSFGKEKLLLFGDDEVSWAQNRRDDFVIVQ